VLSILALSPERSMTLLYVLLAFTSVLFTALAIVSLRRVSTAWEALEGVQVQSENSRATAWHNLSEVQRALDTELSSKLQAIHGQLLNVSQEMEMMRWKVTRCEASCGGELSDRLRALEERDVVEPVQQQLAEVRQEQSRVSALLTRALEETRSLSEILCTTCPAGWQQFFRTCYFFSTTTKSWFAAKEDCGDFNAHLVVVDSEQENEFLRNNINRTSTYWLGVTDQLEEGTWVWMNGEGTSISYWNTWKENKDKDQKDCGSIGPDGIWNADRCSHTYYWICEKS
ncbi:CL17A protein, partial [Heliornis fulica]|nr:CL17A protein [Heliornis fulica]